MNSNTHPPGVACLRAQALHALAVDDWPASWPRAIDDAPIVDTERRLEPTRALPGRPAPGLVSPQQLRHRSPASPEGRAALLHALAHIEFNAVNLALDIIWRFAGMPTAFYLDWLRVAREEAYHFELLNQRLASLGHVYGDFPRTTACGTWPSAPVATCWRGWRWCRALEARGLDASPMIRDKLNSVGDAESAAVLDIILADEIGHVAIGNRWFKHLCAQQGRDPVACYAELALHGAPRLRGPFNLEARRAAGFDETELAALQAASPTL